MNLKLPSSVITAFNYNVMQRRMLNNKKTSKTS